MKENINALNAEEKSFKTIEIEEKNICSYLKLSDCSLYVNFLNNYYQNNNTTDNPLIYRTNDFPNYLPLFTDFLNDLQDSKLRLISLENGVVNASNNIETSNDFKGSHHRSFVTPSVKRKKYIDISRNDIVYGSKRLILNLSNYNIVVKEKNKIEQNFAPLENEVLKRYFGGSILILDIFTLTNPVYISEEFGNRENYLEVKSKQVPENSREHKIYKAALNYYNNLIHHRNTILNLETSIGTNISRAMDLANYEIVFLSIVNETIFQNDNNNNKQIRNIFIRNLNLLISIDNIYTDKSNYIPIYDEEVEQTIKMMSSDVYLYEIIDNDSYLGDRFINIYHKPVKITKYKDTTRKNGLHIFKLANKQKELKEIIPLEEIDKLGYIFKSEEEATKKLDNEKMFEQYIKEKDRELKEQEIRLKELEKQNREAKLKSDKELENIRTEFEKENIELKSKYEKLKYEHEKELSKLKEYYEDRTYRRKDYFEERSYERNETLETLKTIAAVAGVAATGFLIFQKLNK